jgi:hypothetical protein
MAILLPRTTKRRTKTTRLYASIGLEVPAALASDGKDDNETISSTNRDGEKAEKNGGLGTGLRPSKVNLSAPKAPDLVETFLKRLEEEEVLALAMQYNPNNIHTGKAS